jgi:hypothetical protein
MARWQPEPVEKHSANVYRSNPRTLDKLKLQIGDTFATVPLASYRKVSSLFLSGRRSMCKMLWRMFKADTKW